MIHNIVLLFNSWCVEIKIMEFKYATPFRMKWSLSSVNFSDEILKCFTCLDLLLLCDLCYNLFIYSILWAFFQCHTVWYAAFPYKQKLYCSVVLDCAKKQIITWASEHNNLYLNQFVFITAKTISKFL